MDRTNLLTIAVFSLLLLNLLTIGFLIIKPGKPNGPERPRPQAGEGPARIVIDRLEFDSQQQQHYQQLVSVHQQQTRRLNDQSVRLVQDYYNLLKSSELDSTLASTLRTQIGQNQVAQVRLNFTHFQQIKALCRPEQQARFNQLVSDLSRLFGRQQRPRHRPNELPEDGPHRP